MFKNPNTLFQVSEILANEKVFPEKVTEPFHRYILSAVQPPEFLLCKTSPNTQNYDVKSTQPQSLTFVAAA